MRRPTFAWACALLALLAAGAGSAKGSCDRACLQRVGETYLQALAAKDPKRLSLSAEARFTENGSELKLGDGLWGTIERLGDYRLFVIDEASSNIGIFQSITEAGHHAFLGVRIKAPDGQIGQIETLVARSDPSQQFGEKPRLDLRAPLTAPLTAGARVSRSAMIAAADSYFVGLEEATDKGVAFGARCVRRENGMQTTSNPAFGNDMAKLDCKQQFATGFSTFITGLRERRWIVDEETGVAMAFLFFDHNGTVKSVPLADGTTMEVPYPFTRPYSFQLFEAFKIDSGKIQEVEALLTTVPYGMRSGWSGKP